MSWRPPNFLALFIFACCSLSLVSAQAKKTKDQSEREYLSLRPVVDTPLPVMSRKLNFDGRVEVSTYVDWILNEAFYSNRALGFELNYHFSNEWGAFAKYQTWEKGLSEYSKQFQSIPSNLQFERASGPESLWMLGALYRFGYGKISLSKDTVFPVSWFTSLGYGQAKYGSRSLPWIDFSLNYELFIASKWSLFLQGRFIFREKVNALSGSLRGEDPAPSKDSFGTRWSINTGLGLGTAVLF